eukprot:7882443-Ditylum_brightwellii.AAC.1
MGYDVESDRSMGKESSNEEYSFSLNEYLNPVAGTSKEHSIESSESEMNCQEQDNMMVKTTEWLAVRKAGYKSFTYGNEWREYIGVLTDG